MNVKTNEHGDCVLVVTGEIDVYTSPKLKEKLHELALEYVVIALDLSGVTYIDSTGLGVMIGVHQAINHKKRWGAFLDAACRCRCFYIVDDMTPMIRKIFKSTGLNHKLQFGRPATAPSGTHY